MAAIEHLRSKSLLVSGIRIPLLYLKMAPKRYNNDINMVIYRRSKRLEL